MTKEELKQEAEEWLCNNLHSASEEDFIKAMVDIAEPREKRIAELTEHNETLMLQIQSLGKENAELKNKLTEKVTLESLDVVSGKVTELEAQIEQLQKINNEQKETLKKVRVALIQERTANIMNYGKGGVEMFDSMFEILKGVSN